MAASLMFPTRELSLLSTGQSYGHIENLSLSCDGRPPAGDVTHNARFAIVAITVIDVMSSMYAYPLVPRCEPEDIPIPDCMYQIRPISDMFVGKDVESRPAATSTVSDEDRQLQRVIAAQERLMSRIDTIDRQLKELIGTTAVPTKSTPTGKADKKARSNMNVKNNSDSEHQAVSSILKRQEDLIQRIDGLCQSLSSSLKVSPQKQENITPITKQKVTDVSVFVKSGTGIDPLLAFFRWLMDEKGFKVLLKTHSHSSALGAKPLISWSDITEPECYWRTSYDLTVTLIVTQSAPVGEEIRSFIDPKQGTVSGVVAVVAALAKKLSVDYNA